MNCPAIEPPSCAPSSKRSRLNSYPTTVRFLGAFPVSSAKRDPEQRVLQTVPRVLLRERPAGEVPIVVQPEPVERSEACQ